MQRVASVFEERISVSSTRICDSVLGGKGIYAAREIGKGELVTEYKGDEDFHTRSLTLHGARQHTHTLRVKEGGGRVINGLVVSQSAQRVGGGCWSVAPQYQKGIGAIMNAADARKDVNVRMVWVPDDRGRSSSRKLTRVLASILPKAAFFVAARTIRKGEELLWWYKPKVFEEDVDILDDATEPLSRSPSQSPRRSRSRSRSKNRSRSKSPRRQHSHSRGRSIGSSSDIESLASTQPNSEA
jgi:hypothetical protein